MNSGRPWRPHAAGPTDPSPPTGRGSRVPFSAGRPRMGKAGLGQEDRVAIVARGPGRGTICRSVVHDCSITGLGCAHRGVSPGPRSECEKAPGAQSSGRAGNSRLPIHVRHTPDHAGFAGRASRLKIGRRVTANQRNTALSVQSKQRSAFRRRSRTQFSAERRGWQAPPLREFEVDRIVDREPELLREAL